MNAAPEANPKHAARIAALKTLKPGDIIVSGNSESVYTGAVTEVCEGGELISLAYLAYTFQGAFRSVEANTYTAVANVIEREFLRIHRATEGAL